MLRDEILLHKAVVIAIIIIFYSSVVSADLTGIQNSLASLICGIYSVFVGIAGAVASLVFVIAGVKWIASENDPGARKQAKDIMVQALVGLIIILVANDIIQAITAGYAGVGTCS